MKTCSHFRIVPPTLNMTYLYLKENIYHTFDWLYIGILVETQPILDWHLGRESAFSINAWVGQHSAGYWPNVVRVPVKCQLTSIPLCMFCSIVTCDWYKQHNSFCSWLFVDGNVDWGPIKSINWHLTTIPLVHMIFPAYSCLKYLVLINIIVWETAWEKLGYY